MPAAAAAVHKLVRDAVMSIYSMLSFKELARASSVSQIWRAASLELAPRRESIQVDLKARETLINALVRRPKLLKRHVIAITSPPGDNSTVRLSRMELELIAEMLPNLESLTCDLTDELVIGSREPWPLPPKLTDLALYLQGLPRAVPGVIDSNDAVMRLIRDVATLTGLKSLLLHLQCGHDVGSLTPLPATAFEPLRHLTQLEAFKFAGFGWLQSQHLIDIRHLPALTCLCIVNPSETQLGELVNGVEGPGGSASASSSSESVSILNRVKKLAWGGLVKMAIFPLLLRFTSLESLAFSTLERDLSGIDLPTSLKALQLCCYSSDVQMPLLVTALKQLNRMEEFEIQSKSMTDADLTQIVRSWPNLRRLTLKFLWMLTSLNFLSASPTLALTLQYLCLYTCIGIPLVEIYQLRTLTALEELELTGSFDELFDSNTRAILTPGSPSFESRYWPKLRRIELRLCARRHNSLVGDDQSSA